MAKNIDQGFNFFEKEHEDCGVENLLYQDHLPISGIPEHGPIEFSVKNAANYMALHKSRLYIKARILLGDKAIKAGETDVVISNLGLHALFSQIDVSLNNKLLYNSASNYHLKSFIDCVTSGSTADPSTSAEYYFFDDRNVNDANKEADASTSYYERKKLVKNGQFVQLEGVLKCDIFQVEKYIPSGVNVYLKLYRNPASIVLTSDDGFASQYSLEISEAVFKACKIYPKPEIIQAHERLLNEGRHITIPLQKGEINTYVIGTGATTFGNMDLFQSRVPAQMIIAVQETGRLYGNFKKPVYNFTGQNLQTLTVFLNGQPHQQNTLHFDPSQDFAMDAYTMFINNTNAQISYEAFKKGHTMYPYNFFAKSRDCTPTAGTVGVRLNFAKPVTENLTVIIYAKFPTYIEINKTRDVLLG